MFTNEHSLIKDKVRPVTFFYKSKSIFSTVSHIASNRASVLNTCNENYWYTSSAKVYQKQFVIVRLNFECSKTPFQRSYKLATNFHTNLKKNQ